MSRARRLQVVLVSGILVVAALAATPPATAVVPVTAGEGIGSGFAKYQSRGTNFPPPCGLFTDSDYTATFGNSRFHMRHPFGQGAATYQGPLTLHLNSTDSAWYADPTTEYSSQDPTPQDGNACVGNAPGYGVGFAGTLQEPTWSTASGTVSCSNLSGKSRRVSVEIVYTLSGTCTVTDAATGNTVTGRAVIVVDSILMKANDPTADACNGGPPTECNSTDAFVAGPST